MTELIKKNILHLIAQGDLQEAIATLLKEIPDDFQSEAVLHAARFSDLQKQIRLGLMDYENQSVTRSQIRYGIMQTLQALEGNQTISVLVAGTGKYHLPNEVYQATAALGKLLGEADFHLVCGGWEGVDYVIAEEFSKAIMTQGKPLSENLVQVVAENKTPIFKGGNTLYVKQGLKEWLEAIKYADVVVLIGGEGGTYETFTYAHQEGRPVIPIPASGGDALRVFQEILTQWEYWQTTRFKNSSREEFIGLNQPIITGSDGRKVGERVVAMIKGMGKK